MVAKSVHARKGACETVRKVAKAAMDGSAPGTSGFAGLTVQVDGQTWVCQDRQGDDDPDPHGLCANTGDESEEEVRLYS